MDIDNENRRIYFSKIIGGFNIYSTADTLHVHILYSGMLKHSLPMCWNLLSNTLLRMRTNISEYSIKTSNQPLYIEYRYYSGNYQSKFNSIIFSQVVPFGKQSFFSKLGILKFVGIFFVFSNIYVHPILHLPTTYGRSK